MTHVRLLVDLEPTEVDEVSGALWTLGTTGIEEQQRGGRVRLAASFADPAGAGRARTSLGRGDVELLTDDGWLDTWRRHASVARAGQRIVVRPAWLDHAPQPGDVVVDVDPGRAFGHGSHPTTRTVLAVVERLVQAGDRVLDVGCGSGLLGVTAARLGAAEVLAIDIDPEAVRVTRDTAARNGVADRVTVAATAVEELGPLDAGWDLVLANVGAAVVRTAAPQIVDACRPGGVIVASGLRSGHTGDLASALALGEPIDRIDHDGWATIVVRRA